MKDKKDPIKELTNEFGAVKDTKQESAPRQTELQFEAVEIDTVQGAYEIAPDTTVEEMKAMFFDADALVEPSYKIWQLNSGGNRYYYRYNEDNEYEFYPSVTTILHNTLPKSPFLVDWIASKGMEEAEKYMNERAAYGTAMHAAFEKLIISGFYDLDGLKSDLKEYIEKNKLPENFIFHADELKKDVLAFAQFCIDYQVKPLAVEVSLVHPENKYAGTIDLPCTMLEKIGGENRISAIVDFKSGRKGFYESCEIQLHLYKDLWNVNFPDMQIERVFNFSPKDWRKKPSYNLKEQTNSVNAKKIPALLELASIEDEKKEKIFTSVSGKINLFDSPNLQDNIISLTLSELVKKKAKLSDLRQKKQKDNKDIVQGGENANNAKKTANNAE